MDWLGKICLNYDWVEGMMGCDWYVAIIHAKTV